MNFVTAKKEETVFVGVMDETFTKVLHLQEAQLALMGKVSIPNTMIECIEAGEDFLEQAKEIVHMANEKQPIGQYQLEEVTLLAPIPRPLKNIMCVGKNYREHAIEMGGVSDIPEHPLFFTKALTTVIGHRNYIESHADVTNQVDYEGELAIIIGKRGTAISKEEAYSYIFGYTIINDVSARDLQNRHKQYFLGKSLDTFCPMGPVIVDRSSIEDPQNLTIETKVNGEVRQSSHTSKMMFDIRTVLSILSKGMTLEPGDIITTGTPAGVGLGLQPPSYLKAGDVIEISIENIGTLVNEVK
ncbi:fumarylacetoacetate hydrolase family protein [Ectobacillus sp. sgz5001026]|uniref:fumarylacetoacetate hydrolase family protein n=1 Tax=Ectobacillus sp. sgz5001026 TaxID=3242473 RepID=UPI0036D2AB06